MPCYNNSNKASLYESIAEQYDEIREEQYEVLPSDLYDDLALPSGGDSTTSKTTDHSRGSLFLKLSFYGIL